MPAGDIPETAVHYFGNLHRAAHSTLEIRIPLQISKRKDVMVMPVFHSAAAVVCGALLCLFIIARRFCFGAEIGNKRCEYTA
jgi:hypothetical protein